MINSVGLSNLVSCNYHLDMSFFILTWQVLKAFFLVHFHAISAYSNYHATPLVPLFYLDLVLLLNVHYTSVYNDASSTGPKSLIFMFLCFRNYLVYMQFSKCLILVGK